MATHSLDYNHDATALPTEPSSDGDGGSGQLKLSGMRSSAVAWAERPWYERLKLVGRVAGQIALEADELTASVFRPAATAGEILASEVLPVAEACRYLARRGGQVLKPRRLSRRGRAWWMGGIDVVESRGPLGLVLIIGPSNYPLFLNAVPMLQALAAGNAVLVKPAPGCQHAMHTLKSIVAKAGVPSELILVLDTQPAAAIQAIQQGVDKVVFTGSYANGKQVAQQLASSLTPATFELSGNDAVLVLDDADLHRVASGLAYALSLNGGQTCIAPRRLFGTRQTLEQLVPLLTTELERTPARPITTRGCETALHALDRSLQAGARLVYGDRTDFTRAEQVTPIVLADVQPTMPVAREDLFAPLLSLIEVRDMLHAVQLANDCPYALGASIFGNDHLASSLASQLRAPCVTINDVIVPTADPRVSFGGSGLSGYGMTRGLEGLRELTQLKVTCQRRGRWMPHLSTPPEKLAKMLHGILLLRHGPTWANMWTGLKSMLK